MTGNDAGTVVMRVILGHIFFIHGLSKFQGCLSNTAVFLKVLEFQGF